MFVVFAAILGLFICPPVGLWLTFGVVGALTGKSIGGVLKSFLD